MSVKGWLIQALAFRASLENRDRPMTVLPWPPWDALGLGGKNMVEESVRDPGRMATNPRSFDINHSP